MTTGAGNSSSASTSLVVDGTTPQISAKQASFTITPGTNALATSYFNIGSYGISGGTTTCKVGSTTITNVSTLPSGTHTLTCTMTTGAGKTSSASTTINVKYPVAETSGANAPQLFDGMIPIKWDSSNNVVKADVNNLSNNPWYNYGSKQWANAVMVTSGTRNTYMNADVGSTINTSDILAYWVWIPRYRYELFNATFESGTTPQIINIVFESVSTTKSIGSTNGTYLTHPAFTFGSTELEGFWVAKFESSGSTSTGLKILPGVTSLRNTTLGSAYTASQQFANTAYLTETGVALVDAHMMKNMEWGAVAYLSHSEYGKNAEIAINYNSNYITGDAYLSNIAMSTTGNVYGVYDMSGCSWEHVMGNLNNASGTSGLTVTSINSKYIDKYTSSTITKTLGDAVGETVGWYSDSAFTGEWFARGGGYGNGSDAGIFSYSYTDGRSGPDLSFRPILSAK